MKYFDSSIQQYFNEVLATGKCRTKEKKMEELFRAMTALEESLLGNASHYLNHTTNEINMSSEHVGGCVKP